MQDADEVHTQFEDALDTDSEEDGYDSDVERERKIDYKSKTYVSRQDPTKTRSKVAKRRSNAKRNKFNRSHPALTKTVQKGERVRRRACGWLSVSVEREKGWGTQGGVGSKKSAVTKEAMLLLLILCLL